MFKPGIQMYEHREIKGIGKGKTVPLQVWRGPEGSRKLR
jgi:hypothetical protein